MGKGPGNEKEKVNPFQSRFFSGIGSGEWRCYVIRDRGDAGLDDSPENYWFSLPFSKT